MPKKEEKKIPKVLETGAHAKVLQERAAQRGHDPVDTAVHRVRIYGFGFPDTPTYEVRWEALNAVGITLYDSGSEREGYSEKEEDQILKDIHAKYGTNVEIEDVR